ncbi:MAG: hypothetical protein V4578_07250, partial [Pseudomonadota bacterium]
SRECSNFFFVLARKGPGANLRRVVRLPANPHEQGLCGVVANYFEFFSKKIKKTLKFPKTVPLPVS